MVVKNHAQQTIFFANLRTQREDDFPSTRKGLLAMNLIKAFLTLFGVKPVDRSQYRLYLRRGTKQQIQRIKPSHNGEIILATDIPELYVALNGAFIPIPIPKEAQPGFIEHYNSRIHDDLAWCIAFDEQVDKQGF